MVQKGPEEGARTDCESNGERKKIREGQLHGVTDPTPNKSGKESYDAHGRKQDRQDTQAFKPKLLR
jgi:hypothetical protein